LWNFKRLFFWRKKPKDINILFIGNSYTHTYSMPDIVQKMATSKGISVNIESDALSGHSFKMHCHRPELFKHISNKKWDYVILQGFSRELSYDKDHLDRETLPYIQKLITAVNSNCPQTKIFFYQTWGYNNGYSHRPEIDTFEKMSLAIQNGYEYISNLLNIEVIPVGRVWADVRFKLKDKLYQADNEHPSIYGSYTAASTFFVALFDASVEGVYRDYRIPEDIGNLILNSAIDIISNAN